MFPAVLEASVEDLIVGSVGHPRVGRSAPTRGGSISIQTAPCGRWAQCLREGEPEQASEALVWLLTVGGTSPHNSSVTHL